LLFDFNPRFWQSLCTYALSTEVNDEGNSRTEMKRKNDAAKFTLINLIKTLYKPNSTCKSVYLISWANIIDLFHRTEYLYSYLFHCFFVGDTVLALQTTMLHCNPNGNKVMYVQYVNNIRSTHFVVWQ